MFKTTGTIVIITILIFLGVVAGVTGAQESKPLCTEHDPDAWHPLEIDTCHYDHHHGGDPNQQALLDLGFRPIEEHFGGSQINAAWHTPGENEMKHEGNRWIVEVFPPGQGVPATRSSSRIQAYRIKPHGQFTEMGMKSRFHSFWMEVYACDRDNPTDCGFIGIGGTADTGCGYSQYFGTPVIGLNETLDTTGCPTFSNSIPYRVVYPPRQAAISRARFAQGKGENRISALWQYAFPGVNQLVLTVTDAEVWMDSNGEFYSMCDEPDYQCPYNQSRIQIRNFELDGRWDKNFFEWTDSSGNPNPACLEPGENCVPTFGENWPQNAKHSFHQAAQCQQSGKPHDKCYQEFDTSPGGKNPQPGAEFWIMPEAHSGGGTHPTPTPQPTVTPCPCECGN